MSCFIRFLLFFSRMQALLSARLPHAAGLPGGRHFAVFPGMNRRILDVVHRGLESGVLASIPQVLVPKAGEHLLLGRKEHADLGPMFVQRMAERAEARVPEDLKWLAASAFHFSYAAFWGSVYALIQERWKPRPWVGGLGLASFLYLITFPKWGGAVQFDVVPEPKRRSWRMELVLASAPLVFSFGTALLYGRGPGEGPAKSRAAEGA